MSTVIVANIVRRLAKHGGAMVPIGAIRRDLPAGLSYDQQTEALLEAERVGAIKLLSAGEDPPHGVSDWIQRGKRGALCWACALQTTDQERNISRSVDNLAAITYLDAERFVRRIVTELEAASSAASAHSTHADQEHAAFYRGRAMALREVLDMMVAI